MKSTTLIQCYHRPWATRNPHPSPRWGFFPVVIFEASEYGPIEIRLFASKLLGLNMLKYANKAATTENPVSSNISATNPKNSVYHMVFMVNECNKIYLIESE